MTVMPGGQGTAGAGEVRNLVLSGPIACGAPLASWTEPLGRHPKQTKAVVDPAA